MLFTPRHDFLIGVDSDGCVFDSMEVKQVMHFHPLIIRHWNLRKVERQLRALAEYVNLHSGWRGSNRFVALLKTFELLEETPSVVRSGVELPDLRPLREWVESGAALSNDSLEEAAKEEPELRRVLEWSLAVNRDVANRMVAIPPFEGAAEAVRRMHERADTVVISLTPVEALEHEWSTHGLRKDVDGIAGQEWGTKQEQLRLALSQKDYDPDKVMLVGDAPGDLKAAREVGVCFYPTVPGDEVASWKRLLAGDLDRFFEGTYRGGVEDARIGEFEAALAGEPPTDL